MATEADIRTISDADELITFMQMSGGQGLTYVGAESEYYLKPRIDADELYDLTKNNYITEQVQRLKSLLFIAPPVIRVNDPDGNEVEELSQGLQAVFESPGVDGWTRMQQAWVDIHQWGCCIVNPVWRNEGPNRTLHKLRRLPPESFGKPPTSGQAAGRRIYSQILRGITLDERGNLECWQTQGDNQQHLLKNVMLLKDPSSTELAGESNLIPIVPLVRALNFAWKAQMQKVKRVGAPVLFIMWKGQPVKDANRDDIQHVKTILANWGKDTAFQLRDNMELVKLDFTDNQSAVQTIEQLEKRLRDYASAATLIRGEGSTISESGGAKVDLVAEWIRGQHNMIEGIYEEMFQELIEGNAYEGYTVDINIPEPSPDRGVSMQAAKVGYDTQSIKINEIREMLGLEPLTEEELEELREDYKSRQPPPPMFGGGAPFGGPPSGFEDPFKDGPPDGMFTTHSWHQHPEGGEEAPKELKALLEKVYSKCMSDKEDTPENKEVCSKNAWTAAKNAGWTRTEEGKWLKHLDDVAELERILMEAPDFKELPAPEPAPQDEEFAADLDAKLGRADRELLGLVVRAMKHEEA